MLLIHLVYRSGIQPLCGERGDALVITESVNEATCLFCIEQARKMWWF